jgi:micrococcal nuclease
MQGAMSAHLVPSPPAGASRPGGHFLFRLGSALFLALFLASAPLHAAQTIEKAKVIEIVDGDTIRVLPPGGKIETVRLVGIDTPERSHPSRPKEFFADEAAEALSALCRGKPVLLEKDLEEQDKYGRLLRYVYSEDGRFLINLELVRKGMSRVYRRFPFSRQAEFDAVESEARREGIGLWQDGGIRELRWVGRNGHTPVTVWPLGGGKYGLVHGGMGKPGIEGGELPGEIGRLLRLRSELSDAEFATEAEKAGFRPMGEESSRAGGETPGRQLSPGIIPWDHAHEYDGKTITVEGTVVRAKRSRKTVFLNFHGNWKRYVTIVLFTAKLPGLPDSPETYYVGKTVRVRGTVKRFKERPEIVVESAAELKTIP